jgi:hypothetical protein
LRGPLLEIPEFPPVFEAPDDPPLWDELLLFEELPPRDELPLLVEFDEDEDVA